MTPKAVVFDIGNVLIEWQPETYFDRIIGAERRRTMFAEVDLHGMNELVDQGHDFRETVYDWAGKYPQWQAEIRMWHDNWLDLAQPVIDHSVRLLAALKARGIAVYALTNFGIGTWAIATPAYPFLNSFDHAFVSGHLGVTKPSERIYQIVETETGLAPSALLFADDRLENIEAAQNRGWHVHLFQNPAGWAECLVAHGLLTEAEAL